MIRCAAPADDSGERGLRRGAPHPRLPSLKKDNCIRNGRHRSVFIAQENIRLYVWKHGVENVGFLTVTTPSECLEPSAFQDKWHSYLTNVVCKAFPTGMWVRERQPRSGNWHAHAVVYAGWDIRTTFPFDQVAKQFYANVDPRLRELWKRLRESAAVHGFGRTELLPLKHSGEACAYYLTSYLAAAFNSEKPAGEEKRRLFSVWGGIRFVYPRFTFLSSRIIQKRKQWLAEMLELPDETCIAKMLGQRWWFHFGKALCEVIMPEDFYKMGPPNDRRFDEVGLRALQHDWAAWPGELSEDLRMRSQFNLFHEIGTHLFGRNSGQALDYAMYFMERRPQVVPVPKPVDPQSDFGFPVRD